MVPNSIELNLELSPPSLKSSLAVFLNEYPIIQFDDNNKNNNFEDLIKINDFIIGLDIEINKIQPFHRELPLSFTLLHHVIGKMKEKVEKWKERRGQNGNFSESRGVNLGIDVVEKKDWMSSVQLWCPRNEEEENRRKSEVVDDAPTRVTMVNPTVAGPVCREVRPLNVATGYVDQTEKQQGRTGCHVSGRKQRRCWSPELHRLFVDALEKLGGSKVATPKQIREHMQVDGLTNDEVKSHLQKYRLHIRKLPAASTKTLSTVDQGINGNTPELGYSNSKLQHSLSPESPLDFSESNKHNVSCMEEEDEKSDGRSWKVQQQPM